MSVGSFFSNLEIDLGFQKDCLSMRKAADGNYLLMCQYSNRWRDRDTFAHPKGGEIVTREAHERYMRWLDDNPNKAPELWSLHLPGTQRKNIAHWWGFDGNFAFAEFKLTPEEALGVKRFVSIYEPGLSHGFFVLKYDADEGLIQEYITYEISILPLEMAANQWTSFELIEKELTKHMYLSDAQRAALVAMHGEDYVKEFESKSRDFAEVLDRVGIDTKGLKSSVQSDVAERLAKKEEVKEEPKTEAVATGNVTLAAFEALQNDLLGALQRLQETLGGDIKALKGLVEEQAERIDELEGTIEEIEVDDEDKVAQKASAAPRSIFANFMPASVIGQDDTELDTTDKKKLKGPAEAKTRKQGSHMLAGIFGGLNNEDEE